MYSNRFFNLIYYFFFLFSIFQIIIASSLVILIIWIILGLFYSSQVYLIIEEKIILKRLIKMKNLRILEKFELNNSHIKVYKLLQKINFFRFNEFEIHVSYYSNGGINCDLKSLKDNKGFKSIFLRKNIFFCWFNNNNPNFFELNQSRRFHRYKKEYFKKILNYLENPLKEDRKRKLLKINSN